MTIAGAGGTSAGLPPVPQRPAAESPAITPERVEKERPGPDLDRWALLSGDSYFATGRVNEKHDPFPSLLSAVIRPPWASISLLAIVRPKPLPPVTLARDLSTL
jgi:hypothetical protein